MATMTVTVEIDGVVVTRKSAPVETKGQKNKETGAYDVGEIKERAYVGGKVYSHNKVYQLGVNLTEITKWLAPNAQ